MTQTQVVETIQKKTGDQIKKLVGQRIRELRIRAGFDTIEAFAEALNKSDSGISQLERGINWIGPGLIADVCEATGFPPSMLFAEELPPVMLPTPSEALDVLTAYVKAPSPIPSPIIRGIGKLQKDERRAILGLIEDYLLKHGIDAVEDDHGSGE